jgi:hypothetical protein
MKSKNIRWIFLLCSIYFISCDKDSNIGQFDDAVVESESNQYKFKQITFTINLVNSKSEYLNITKVDSIKLQVNGKVWGTFGSESIDTTGNTDNFSEDLSYSASKINYLIIAPYILKIDKLDTAGDFVNYLDNRLILTPGDYVCEIAEIKFRDRKDRWKTFKPQVYKDFKVNENTTSSFVGEISIQIK